MSHPIGSLLPFIIGGYVMYELSIYFIEQVNDMPIHITSTGIIRGDGILLHPVDITGIDRSRIVHSELADDHLTLFLEDETRHLPIGNLEVDSITQKLNFVHSNIHLKDVTEDLGNPKTIDRYNDLIIFEHGTHPVPHDVMRTIHGWIISSKRDNHNLSIVTEALSRAVVSDGTVWDGMKRFPIPDDMNWFLEKPYYLIVDDEYLYNRLCFFRDDIYIMKANQGIIITPDGNLITYM